MITDAEYVKISFPNFYEVLTSLGAQIVKAEGHGHKEMHASF